MGKENTWSIDKIFLLLIAITGAVFLRLYFLQFPGYSFDIGTFISWANEVQKIGIIKLYAGSVAIDYPPVIPLISSWWLDFTRTINLGDIYGFKLLPTLAEAMLLFLASYFIIKSNMRYKALFLAFVILQPATAFVTSAWGQVDAIMVLAIVLGFMLSQKNLYLSSIVFAIALLIKPQAAIAVFIYLLWILFKKSILEFIIQLLVGTGVLALAGFISIQYGGNFLPVLWNSASRYPYISMNAFNFWWMLYGPKAIMLGDGSGAISTKVQGLTLFGAFLVPAVYYLKIKAKDLSQIILVSTYSYLIFFTFLTQMHERYLYPAVALLPFAVMASKRTALLYVILSIALLVNCFAILQNAFPQFNYSYLNNIVLTGDWTRVIGLMNVLVSVYLAIELTLASFKGKGR